MAKNQAEQEGGRCGMRGEGERVMERGLEELKDKVVKLNVCCRVLLGTVEQ